MVQVQTPELLQLINNMISTIMTLLETYSYVIMWILVFCFVAWLIYQLLGVAFEYFIDE